MGRDFRPFEQYHYDKKLDNQIKNTEWNYIDEKTGERVPLRQNNGTKEIFPELHFLFQEIDNLYDKHKDNENCLALLKELEAELVKIENEFDDYIKEHKDITPLMNEATPKSYDCFDLRDMNSKEALKSWFYGLLDENFYYHMDNSDTLYVNISHKCDIIKENERLQNGKKDRHIQKGI